VVRLVVELNGIKLGQIIAYKTKIKKEDKEYQTITFGPVCVDISKQGQGIGRYLINYFIDKAKKMGFGAIVIQGYPHYYNKLGFINSKKYGISDE